MRYVQPLQLYVLSSIQIYFITSANGEGYVFISDGLLIA